MVRDSGEHYPAYDLTSKILEHLGVLPDFTSKGSVRYIHRSLPDREIFFVSNRTGKPVEETCTFRNGTLNAEVWDAITGEIRPVNNLAKGPGGISIPIRFDTYQSYFIVFYHSKQNAPPAVTTRPDFPVSQTLLTLEGPLEGGF